MGQRLLSWSLSEWHTDGPREHRSGQQDNAELGTRSTKVHANQHSHKTKTTTFQQKTTAVKQQKKNTAFIKDTVVYISHHHVLTLVCLSYSLFLSLWPFVFSFICIMAILLSFLILLDFITSLKFFFLIQTTNISLCRIHWNSGQHIPVTASPSCPYA